MSIETKKGIARHQQWCNEWRGIISMIEQSPHPDPLQIEALRLLLEHDERTIECIEKGEPLLSSWYGNAIEIYAAMGIHYFCPTDGLQLHSPMNQYHDLEEIDRTNIPSDVCTLIKYSMYGVIGKDILPTPTAIIAMMEPCDGQLVLHEAMKNTEEWGDVPVFALDPPYGTSDEDFQYFAGELKRMILFLEDITGRKMDYGKLREVVEETNHQYEAWAEYNELRRAVPCPRPSWEGSQAIWGVTQHIRAGYPRATKLIRNFVAAAEANVKNHQGAVPNERIRILWADITPVWTYELAPWLAEHWGANVVMDYQGDTPYQHIDTSSEESMLFGLARRCLDEVPMIRQGRGTVARAIEDVTRMIREYKIDCVFFPCHVGHKDVAGVGNFLRLLCRDLKIPMLELSVELFDPRYTPMDILKNQISQFFSVTGLGKATETVS